MVTSSQPTLSADVMEVFAFGPATALLTALFSECVSVWQKTVLIYSGYCAGSLGADSGCYRGRKTAVAKTVCRPERANGLRDSELDT